MNYTVWVQQQDGCGTTYISAIEAEDAEHAVEMVLEECGASWGEEVDNLRVLGVAEGDVKIIDWHDFGE